MAKALTMKRLCGFLILACMAFSAAGAWASNATGRPVGGGILGAGLQAEYFANPDLTGEPVFKRKDVRVNFDWGTLLPIIGSRAENLKNFPRDDFSVRWTGKISPRFSEPYAFHFVFDDGARFFIRPDGTEDWTALIDQWDKAGDVTSKTYPMEANQRYDVKIEYRELKGSAKLLVSWSSPSTPEETLDAASLLTLGGTDAEPYINADAFRCVSPWGTKNWVTPESYGTKPLAADHFDEEHWPTCDARAHWFHQLYPGRYLLEFAGKASVSFSAQNGKGKWVVGQEEYERALPAGAGYNPAENRTRAYLDIESESRAGVGAFIFKETQRDADSEVGTGIRDIRVWRPLAPGSKEHHVPGTAVCNTQRGFADQYVNIRFYRMLKHEAKGEGPATWKGRARPAMDDHMREGGCLEDYILYCNELGRDLYVNVQTGDPTPEFIRKLPLALKYGTDGNEPYDRPVADPLYPPLNPNLRVYFEFMNECTWNYGGISEGIARAKVANNADWQVLNYDGEGDRWGHHRWMGLKSVQFSKAFREVYGDEAMGDRVRVQIFGQYENSWQWFPIAQFIDNYFSNADGMTHVQDPLPVNYHVWGGGGCTYYSCSNPRGRMPGNPLGEPDLEKPELKPGEAAVRPEGSAWTFAGDGGVCDYLPPLTTAITVERQGEAHKASGANERVGFKFTVAAKDIYVPMLGVPTPRRKPRRWRPNLALYDENGKQLMMENRLSRVPDADGYTWGLMESLSAALANRPTPLRLEAGKSYYLLADPGSFGGPVSGDDTALKAAHGITIDGAALGKRSGSQINDLKVTRKGAFGYGPVSFRFTDQPVVTETGDMSRPPFNIPMGRWTEDVDPGGKQCMFLRDGASASQEIDFQEPGVYAVVFWWSGTAGRTVRDNHPNVSGVLEYAIDGESIGAKDFWRAPAGWNEHSSPAFRIEKAGKHTFALAMKKGEAFFDKFKMVSEMALFGGPDAPNFPQGGEAYMGTKSKDWRKKIRQMNSYPMAYGLAVTTYEGGWSIGGDAGWSPFSKYVAYKSPYAAAAQQRVMDEWAKLGGFHSQHHYPQTGDGHDGPNAPLVKGTIAHNSRLAPEVQDDLVHTIPCELTKDDCLFALTAGGMKLPWYAWRVMAPKTGEYKVSAECEGDARLKLLLKESRLIAEGKAGEKLSGKVTLTKGLHVFKLRFVGGKCEAPKLSVADR